MSLRDASVDSSAVDIADRPTAVVRPVPSLPPKSGRVSQAALNAARAAFSLPEGPIGPYRIVREIGCGGMGIVYEAIDDRLKRRAAIKMVRFGVGISDEAMRRFQTEAEAVAKLGHPNIVQIYDIGRHQHQPFVALEYLPGGTLHSRVGNKPQPPRDAADLVRQLALAVQHAHECGVIHRDLKPANILFADDDTPKIGDFGAARITDIDSSVAGLTQAGEVIGTPEYMAPEQARGTVKEIAPPTDVYALGAVLYHMLTGRPPHSGTDTFDVLNSVIHHEPLAPRKLVARVPVDLETICIKAMAKRPADRYPTAQALADDLDRYLAGESIMAKPEPVAARLWRKARRRPLVSGLIAAVVAVSLAGLAGIVWQWQAALAASTLAQRNADRALQESRIKEQSLYRSRIAQAALLIENGDNSKAAELLQMSAGNTSGQADSRHWEWHHLNRLGRNFLWQLPLETASGQAAWPHCIAVSPSARRVAVSCGNPYLSGIWDSFQPCTLYILDAETGEIESTIPDVFQHKIWQMQWIDEDRVVVMSIPFGYKVLHIPDGEVLSSGGAEDTSKKLPAGFQATVSPDGRSYAHVVSERNVAIVDTETGEILRRITVPGDSTRIFDVAQPRSSWLFGVLTTLGASIIDGRDGRTILTLPGKHVDVVAVDPACERMALINLKLSKDLPYSEDHNTRLDCHEIKSGRRLWSVDQAFLGHISILKFGPDGSKIVLVPGNSSRAVVMRKDDGRTICELRGHSNRILDFQFNPDGNSLATASNDGSVRYWSLSDGVERARFRGHDIGARIIAFDPNGWRVFSGGMDGRVMAWDLTRGRADGAAVPHSPLGVCKAPEEGALWGGLWATNDGRVRYLHTQSAEFVTLLPKTGTVESIVRVEGLKARSQKSAVDYVVSADGSLILGPDNLAPNSLTLWDGRTGQMRRRFQEFNGWAVASALSPDTRLAAVAVRDHVGERVVRRLSVYDTATGEVRFQRELDGYNYQTLCFDERRPVLYCGITSLESGRSGIDILDLTTGESSNRQERPSSGIRNIVISPDGDSLAYIDSDVAGNPRLILARSKDLTTIWSQPIVARSVGLSFSPDGRRLAIARFDDAVALYDAATGTEVLHKSIPSHRSGDYAYPARAVFSSDGRSLVSYQSVGLLSIFQSDDWSGHESKCIADRRVEAATAAYSYHLREAAILADQPDSFAYRFHAGWLDRLLAPNDFLRERWEWIRSKGRR